MFWLFELIFTYLVPMENGFAKQLAENNCILFHFLIF